MDITLEFGVIPIIRKLSQWQPPEDEERQQEAKLLTRTSHWKLRRIAN